MSPFSVNKDVNPIRSFNNALFSRVAQYIKKHRCVYLRGIMKIGSGGGGGGGGGARVVVVVIL